MHSCSRVERLQSGWIGPQHNKLTKATKEEEIRMWFLGLRYVPRGPKQCLWRPPYTAEESSMFLSVHELLPALDSTIASQLPSLWRQ